MNLWITKYIIGEILRTGGATFYKNPFDQTVKNDNFFDGVAPSRVGIHSGISPYMINKVYTHVVCMYSIHTLRINSAITTTGTLAGPENDMGTLSSLTLMSITNCNNS